MNFYVYQKISKYYLYFKANYINYFPNIEIVKYKTFNKHATNLWCVIRYIHTELMKKFNKCDLYLADGFPLPLCHLLRNLKWRLAFIKLYFISS